MGTVTFDVSSIDETSRRATVAFAGELQPPRISFASAESLFTTMTAPRWTLVQRMAGAGPLSVAQIAKRLDRDPDEVWADVLALLKSGVIDSTGDGRVIFPYTGIHVDFVLEAAA